VSLPETAKTHATAGLLAREQEAATRKSLGLDERPMSKTITLGEKGEWANPHLADLLLEIAKVNDVTCNVARDKTYVRAFGTPTDVAFTRKMFHDLSKQMVELANQGATLRWHRQLDMTAWQFKVNFFRGFERGVRAQLEAGRDRAITDGDDGSHSTAAAYKRLRIETLYAQTSQASRRTYRGGPVYDENPQAQQLGEDAAYAAGRRQRSAALEVRVA